MGTIGVAVTTQVVGRIGPMSCSPTRRYRAARAPPRPGLPLPILCDPDPALIVPRSDGTIAPDGGPLTTTGYRRIRQWQQEGQAPPRPVIPAGPGRERTGDLPPPPTSPPAPPVGGLCRPGPALPPPPGRPRRPPPR